MDEKKEELITQKQLARRWHCSASAVYERECEGVIKRVGSQYGAPPGVLYRMSDILRLETGEDASPMSQRDREDYEKEIAALKAEKMELVGYIQDFLASGQAAISKVFKNGGYI